MSKRTLIVRGTTLAVGTMGFLYVAMAAFKHS